MFLKLSAAGGLAVRGPRQFPRLQARGRRPIAHQLDEVRRALPARPNCPMPTPPGSSRRRCAAGPGVEHDAAWQQNFSAMIEKARPHGWIDDEDKAIKAHVEWATPDCVQARELG